MVVAERLLEQAKARDHANSLCHALALGACPIARGPANLIWPNSTSASCMRPPRDMRWPSGMLSAAPIEACFSSSEETCRPDCPSCAPLSRSAVSCLRAIGCSFSSPSSPKPWAVRGGPRRGSRRWKGRSTVPNAPRRVGSCPSCCASRADSLRLDGTPAAADSAEGCVQQALQLAKTQDALSWELRAATSLATLHGARDRSDEAIACLRPTYARFTEGFDTADLIAAKALLGELGDSR